MFDVIIVGAGPAGTAAAFDLLDAGFKVLILDKYEFPRKKACAGGITPKGYNLFKYDISSKIRRECTSVKISSKKSDSLMLKSENTLCYMTKRDELDLFSLEKVIDKGAVFKVVEKIVSIEQGSAWVSLRTGCSRFRALYIIGADGANSSVRRFVTKNSVVQRQFALEGDLVVDDPGRFFMEFDFSFIKNGYFWVFPKDDHLNVGIYSVDSLRKPSVGQLKELSGLKTGSDKLSAVKGYPICTGGYRYDAQPGRVLLAGDAAGFAEKLFGEGIAFALASGQKAASAIISFSNAPAEVVRGYLNSLKALKVELGLYDLNAAFFYRFQRLSLKILEIPCVRKHFVNGHGNGMSLARMVVGGKIVKAAGFDDSLWCAKNKPF